MLQIARVTAFIVAELLRENHQRGKFTHPRLELNLNKLLEPRAKIVNGEKLTLLFIMLKNGQTYFKNVVV